LDFYTDVAPPRAIESTQIVNINYTNNNDLSQQTYLTLLLPKINQKNGTILTTYLFIIRTSHLNQTIDAANLTKEKLLQANDCVFNETLKMNQMPCLFQVYTRDDNNFTTKSLLLIGSNVEELANNSIITNNGSIKHVLYHKTAAPFIEKNGIYRFLMLFQIGYVNNTNTQLRDYFVGHLSDAMETNQNDKYKKSGLFNDLALWLTIGISIGSTFVLLAFVTLTVMIVMRLKPTLLMKHKTATSAISATYSTSQASSSYFQNKTKNNNKLVTLNGIQLNSNESLDFIPPSEFSKSEMQNKWLLKHANSDLILEEEYRHLPDFRNKQTSHSSQAFHNEMKNRFIDIKAYDDSRVVLSYPNKKIASSSSAASSSGVLNHKTTSSHSSIVLSTSIYTSSASASASASASENNSDSDSIRNQHQTNTENNDKKTSTPGDYINANFIQGYKHENKFIATQGPKKETIADFWHMVSQYRVHAIVMLTKLVEKGIERCTQYWPEKLNTTEQYGDYEVTWRDQQKCGDYIKRTFDVVNINTDFDTAIMSGIIGTPAANRRYIQTVTQYYYPEWPDKDTPSTDPMSILHLIRGKISQFLNVFFFIFYK
jgi:protein tyrosine phosphatase